MRDQCAHHSQLAAGPGWRRRSTPSTKTGGLLRASYVTSTSVKKYVFLLGYWGARLDLTWGYKQRKVYEQFICWD